MELHTFEGQEAGGDLLGCSAFFGSLWLRDESAIRRGLLGVRALEKSSSCGGEEEPPLFVSTPWGGKTDDPLHGARWGICLCVTCSLSYRGRFLDHLVFCDLEEFKCVHQPSNTPLRRITTSCWKKKSPQKSLMSVLNDLILEFNFWQ